MLRKAAKKGSEVLFVAITLLTLTLVLQHISGAYDSEFGSHPDESGHYVTGVMVYRYLVSGEIASPMQFARSYYEHYPKVAIGHWPPGFYLLEALWALPFTASRTSILILLAVLTTILGTSLYVSAREIVGAPAGLGMAGLLLALPIVQRASSMVMAETLLAILCFWAMRAFGRFLDTGRSRYSVMFGLWSAAAIGVKGNGVALALVPLLGSLLMRGGSHFRTSAFWWPPLIVVVLCGPWYAATASMVQRSFAGGALPSATYASIAAPFYLNVLFLVGGIAIAAVTALGIGDRIAAVWRKGRVEGGWAAAGSLLLATWLFHCLVPSSREARHMIMAIPAVMLFAAAGVACLARHVEWLGPDQKRRMSVVATLLGVAFLAEGFAVPPKAWSGFGGVVRTVLAGRTNGVVVLVASDARGEGMLVSEVARLQPDARHIILRGSKALAQSGWNGENYKLLYATAEDVARYLDRAGVAIVVIDESAPQDEAASHRQLLRTSMHLNRGRWRHEAPFPTVRGGLYAPGALNVYQRIEQKAIAHVRNSQKS